MGGIGRLGRRGVGVGVGGVEMGIVELYMKVRGGWKVRAVQVGGVKVVELGGE